MSGSSQWSVWYCEEPVKNVCWWHQNLWQGEQWRRYWYHSERSGKPEGVVWRVAVKVQCRQVQNNAHGDMGTGNTQHDYYMGQTTLETTEIEKDLGVFLTSDCKVSIQRTKAAAKTMNCLRVIKRSFQYIDTDSFSILFNVYIRPHIEYCVQAWSPGLQKDIKTLQKVQRRATKLVPAMGWNRWIILHSLSLPKTPKQGDTLLSCLSQHLSRTWTA